MVNSAFNIMFGFVLVYVILGNYLYFAKILPALKGSPKLLPTGQLRDVDRYLELLDEQGEHPWFAPLLRNVRAITFVYLFGFAVTVAVIIGD